MYKIGQFIANKWLMYTVSGLISTSDICQNSFHFRIKVLSTVNRHYIQCMESDDSFSYILQKKLKTIYNSHFYFVKLSTIVRLPLCKELNLLFISSAPFLPNVFLLYFQLFCVCLWEHRNIAGISIFFSVCNRNVSFNNHYNHSFPLFFSKK